MEADPLEEGVAWASAALEGAGAAASACSGVPADAAAYLPLAGVDLLLCARGLLLYRKRWAAPEYSFFWGKAMSW